MRYSYIGIQLILIPYTCTNKHHNKSIIQKIKAVKLVLKKTILSSVYATVISLVITFIIMLVAALVAVKLEDPSSVTDISAIIALISGALFCGIICSVMSGGNTVSAAISGCMYICFILLISLIIAGLGGPFDDPSGFGKKFILIAVSFLTVIIGSFISKKRKHKKRSAASLRAEMLKRKR